MGNSAGSGLSSQAPPAQPLASAAADSTAQAQGHRPSNVAARTIRRLPLVPRQADFGAADGTKGSDLKQDWPASFLRRDADGRKTGSCPAARAARAIEWSGPGLNRRHMDFQSIALPTELPDQLATEPEPRWCWDTSNRGVVTDFSRRWPTGKRAWQDRCGRFASRQSVRKKRENSDQRPLWVNPVDEVGVQKITEREANYR